MLSEVVKLGHLRRDLSLLQLQQCPREGMGRKWSLRSKEESTSRATWLASCFGLDFPVSRTVGTFSTAKSTVPMIFCHNGLSRLTELSTPGVLHWSPFTYRGIL